MIRHRMLSLLSTTSKRYQRVDQTLSHSTSFVKSNLSCSTRRSFRNVYNSYFYIYEQLEKKHQEKLDKIEYPKKEDLEDNYIIDELLMRVPIGFDMRYLQFFAIYLKNRGQVKHFLYLKERLVIHWNDMQTKMKQAREGNLPKDDTTTMDVTLSQHRDPSIPFNSYLHFNEVMEIYLMAALGEACRLGKPYGDELFASLNLLQNNPKKYLSGSLGYEMLLLYCTDQRMVDFAKENNIYHDFMDASIVINHLVNNEHLQTFIPFNLLWLVAYHEKSLVSEHFAALYKKSERGYRLFYYIIVALKEQTKKVPNRTIRPLPQMTIERMKDELFDKCEDLYGISRSDLKEFFDLKPREGKFWQSMKDDVLH